MLHLRLIILSVGGNVPIDSVTLLVTDFVNLKIKPAQFFGGAHRGRVCVLVFIGVSDRACMSIYVCTVFLKKHKWFLRQVSLFFLIVSLFYLFLEHAGELHVISLIEEKQLEHITR
jgi:hypothetical protein